MRPRIRFLYTGGTLGMVQSSPGPLAPALLASDVVAYVRGLEQEVDVEAELLFNLDSSDMGPAHWERLAEAVERARGTFDGVVVLHGTDTMAYTASALSFLLEELDLPVVLTGAQRPIAYVRTDARANIIHSALCAAMDVPEVCIYFGRWLFRGNRVSKTSIQSYEAMESPNLPPLLEMGVACVPHEAPLRREGPFRRRTGFCEEVAVVQVVPGATPWQLDAAAAAGAKGVVLRGFGAGNLPCSGWPAAIRRASDAGVVVVIESQCLYGAVDLTAYEGGQKALEAGALSAGPMTTEATVVKLMFLLAQGELHARWATSIAGER